MKKFLLIADLPPSPFDNQSIEDYKGLGFDTVILTEDNVQMIQDGKISEDYEKAIYNLQKHDLNIWIRNVYNSPDYFDNPSECEGDNYGSKYTLSPRYITNEFSSFEKVNGFYMADEPYMKRVPDHLMYPSFDQFGKLIDFKNKYYPNHYFHMNMVPSSSWDHYYIAGNKILDYEDFIRSYIDTVINKIESGGRSICLDNYPFIGFKYIEPDYLYDLIVVATLTKEYNAKVPENKKANFGICIQSFEAKSTTCDGRIRDIVSSSEISFQLFVGMALGARLFEYFAYRSVKAFDLKGIMNEDGTKRIYDLVKDGNEKALPYGQYVLDYEWQSADFYRGSIREFSNPIHNAKKYLCHEHGLLKDIDSEYDTLLGYFKKDVKEGFMVVNYTDPQKEHVNKMSLCFEDLAEVQVYQNGELKTVSLEKGKLSLTLDVGEAAFIMTGEK